MPNLNQAPILDFSTTKKNKGQFYMIPQDLSDIIFRELGNSSAQLRVMMVLLGTKKGFAISDKWICDRASLQHSSYIRARQSLVDKGWLTLVSGKSITVNIDKIYGKNRGDTVLPLKNRGDTMLPRCSDVVLPCCSDTMLPITYNITDKETDNCGVAATGGCPQPPEQVEERGDIPPIPESIANQAIGGYTYIDKEKGIIKINQTNKIYKIQKDSSFITNSEEILKKKEKI